MNQRKWNIKPWYSLGLALLLCMAALVTATGPAMARYKTDRKTSVTFQVRSPAQVCLGTVKTVEKKNEETEEVMTEEVFVPGGTMNWETVTEDEVYLLKLAIANGTSDTSYSQKKQQVSIRLISSVGITENTVISLRLPPETEGGEERIIPSVATKIEEGTSLYMTNGYGYVYTFHEYREGEDTPGQELSWLLPGGELVYLPMTIAMTGALPEHPSLVQPMVIADLA